MQEWTYDGPVLIFDKCVADKWHASTFAVSEKKAKSNLKYRFKKEHGYVTGTRVDIPGKLSLSV